MAVYVSNITIPIGSDFEQIFTVENVNNTPLDLGAYTGAASLKKHPASLTITASFHVSFPDRSNGKVKISLGSSITSGIRPGRYSYDLILSDGVKTNRVIEGSAIVSPGVTISGISTEGPGSSIQIGGSQGIQGTQGPQGFQGIQGIQGNDGLFAGQGIQGIQGNQGIQGVDGAFISQGIQGISGSQGIQGTQGIQGWYGVQGAQGRQGIQGNQGTQGTQGTQGILGTQGRQGIQGIQGLQGAQGNQGIQGEQGIQGDFGPQGTQGLQGIQGIQGNDGAFVGQGIQGIQGIQGDLGIQGVQGIQGVDGLFAAQGIQGIQGFSGEGYWKLAISGIHTTTKVGIGTTIPNCDLNVYGDVRITGITTANIFNGDVSNSHKTFYVSNLDSTSYQFSSVGAGFTETKQNPTLYLTRGQKYHFDVNADTHPFLIKTVNESGSTNTYNYGVENNGAQVGIITFTVPFDSPSILYYKCEFHSSMGGVINVNGVPSRSTITATTGNIGSANTANIEIPGFKSYLLQKIETSAASWVTIYTDNTSRENDALRTEDVDPLPGSGVIGEFISTEAKSQLFTPGTIGFNNDNPVSPTIYAKVVNKSGVSTDISVSLTILQMES